MSKNLYRFFALPGNTIASLEKDNISINDSTTINEILSQRIELQQQINKLIHPNPDDHPEASIHPKDLPEPYFSLYKINYLIHHELLWLSKLETLNDISEAIKWMTLPFFEKWCEELGKPLAKKQRKELQQESEKSDGYLPWYPLKDKKYYGITSFCMNHNNQSMWAHYANGHFGICIGFDICESLSEAIQNNEMHFGECLKENGRPGLINVWNKISYHADKPEIWDVGILEHYENEYQQIIKHNPKVKNYAAINEYSLAIINLISQKAPCWEPENEWRLFLFGLENNIELNYFKDREINKPYLTLSNLYFVEVTH